MYVYEYKYIYIAPNRLNVILSVLQMDESAGIEAEYHHKSNRVSFGPYY